MKFTQSQLVLLPHVHPPTLICPSRLTQLSPSRVPLQDKMPLCNMVQLQRLRPISCSILHSPKLLFLLMTKEKLPFRQIYLDKPMRLLLRVELKQRTKRLLLGLPFYYLNGIQMAIWSTNLHSFLVTWLWGLFYDCFWMGFEWQFNQLGLHSFLPVVT